MSEEDVRKAKIFIKPSKIETLDEYYTITDAVSSLERLRNYQLADILGKYKIF